MSKAPKHPVIVKVDEDVFQKLRFVAASQGMTHNQFIASMCAERVSEVVLPEIWGKDPSIVQRE